jgi:hypothetical protein
MLSIPVRLRARQHQSTKNKTRQLQRVEAGLWIGMGYLGKVRIAAICRVRQKRRVQAATDSNETTIGWGTAFSAIILLQISRPWRARESASDSRLPGAPSQQEIRSWLEGTWNQ